jgi:hypothetical protein
MSAVIEELQTFGSYVREIDSEARKLRLFLFGMETDPFAEVRGHTDKTHQKFELPEGVKDFAWAAGERTKVYQDARYFGQSLVDDMAVVYGAISTCILPVLYALLGTCAYLLRSFEQRVSNQTYTEAPANAPRFLIAGIAGAVVGLFNNFAIGQGASIPPLAIAFLTGYSVDVFFAFLEALSQKFAKSGEASPASTEAGGGKG